VSTLHSLAVTRVLTTRYAAAFNTHLHRRSYPSNRDDMWTCNVIDQLPQDKTQSKHSMPWVRVEGNQLRMLAIRRNVDTHSTWKLKTLTYHWHAQFHKTQWPACTAPLTVKLHSWHKSCLTKQKMQQKIVELRFVYNASKKYN
jgi:hypothetical protein